MRKDRWTMRECPDDAPLTSHRHFKSRALARESASTYAPLMSRRRFLARYGKGALAVSAGIVLTGCVSSASGSVSAEVPDPPMDTPSQTTPAAFDTFSAKLDAVRAEGTFLFLWVSDSHAKIGDDRLRHAYDDLDAAFDLAEDLKPDMILHAGDIVDGSEGLDVYHENAEEYAALMATSPVPLLVARGNHDDNCYYTVNVSKNGVRSEVEDTAYVAANLIRPAVDGECVFDDAAEGCYFYRDFPASKIRVVVLDTNDIPYRTGSDDKLVYTGLGQFGVGGRQVEWLARTALALPEEGWGVIVVSHINVRDDRPYGLNAWGEAPTVSNGQQVWDVLQAFKMHRTGRSVNRDADFACDVSYDFASGPAGELICYLNGHIHRDNCAFLDDVYCASVRQLTNKDGACVDAVVVDRANGKIYFRTYDTPVGQPGDWDIDLAAQSGVPTMQNFYFGKTIDEESQTVS